MERGDPTLYHGTKQSYFGPVNFKFIRGVVTIPPLVSHVTKKGLVGRGLTIRRTLSISIAHVENIYQLRIDGNRLPILKIPERW